MSEHVAGQFKNLELLPSKAYFCFNC